MRGNWRLNRTATYWPQSYGHNSVSFLFSRAAQLGAPSLSETCSHSTIFSLRLWTMTAQSGALGPASLWAGSLYRILTPTDFFLSSPGLYNCSTYTFFLWASHIALDSTRLRSRLYPNIPRPDAPVIYTGAFPILTAWPGSICYKYIRFLCYYKWKITFSWSKNVS